MSRRTLFIGDVHGCYDELIALTIKISLIPEDHLYFVGDLINKWPKSLEVIDWIHARPNTWSVIGNHELYSLVQYGEDTWVWDRTWREIQWWKSQDLRNILRENWYDRWLLSLPHIIEDENFIVVHGGLHPEYWLDTPKEIATLIRVYKWQPWYTYYEWEKPIIYGHWAADGLRIRSNTIWLDTGCCFGGHLTAYCIETREIWQVRADTVYKEPENWKIKSP